MLAISIEAACRTAHLFRVKPRLRLIREISPVTKITILEIQRRTAREFLRVAQRRRELAGHPAWQSVRQRFHHRPPQHLGYGIKGTGKFHRQLPRIAGKDFVAAHPRKHHRQSLARGARYQVTGNCHVDRRLVQMIDELRQQLGHVGLQHDLVIVGVQLLIYSPRPLNVVRYDVIAQVFRFDADSVRANAPPVAVVLHHRQDH